MDYAETLLEIKQEMGNLQSSVSNLKHLVYFLLVLIVEKNYFRKK